MREVCFIIAGEQILGIYVGSRLAIPDSRDRWQVIWKHRKKITEIAHTHPGGLLRFSETDLTTMEAVESGIGRRLAWSIVTSDGYLFQSGARIKVRLEDPWWLESLRELSFGSGPEMTNAERIATSSHVVNSAEPTPTCHGIVKRRRIHSSFSALRED